MDFDDSPTEANHSLQSLSNSHEGDLSSLVITSTPNTAQPKMEESIPAATEDMPEAQAEAELKISESDGQKEGEDCLADDDFGDFGHYASDASPMFPSSDEGETRFSKFTANVSNQDVKSGINVIWPVLKDLDSRSGNQKGLIQDKNNIGPCVSDGDWVALYSTLVNDTVFSENGGGRLAWRRSMIRQKFLESLNISQTKTNTVSEGVKIEQANVEVLPVKESVSKQVPKAKDQTQSTPLNDREKDLQEAKKICDFPEEELRKKSIQELEIMMQNLKMFQQKMYEQANYWLDAKEQLIMDAETHNKVIASLVQYARDQQQAPKAKSTTNPGKKK